MQFSNSVSICMSCKFNTHTHTHTHTHTRTLQLIYVMPSTSSLMSTYSKRADKLKFFNELSQLRDSQRKKKGLKPAGEAYKDAGRKPLEVLTREALLASEQARSTIKKKSSEPLDEKKFGGMTEEEVCKRELPDHMKPGLDIIFVRKILTL